MYPVLYLEGGECPVQIKHLGKATISLVDTDQAVVRVELEHDLNLHGRDFVREIGRRTRHIEDVSHVSGQLILEINDVRDDSSLRRVTKSFLKALQKAFEKVTPEQLSGFTDFPSVDDAMVRYSRSGNTSDNTK